MEKLINYLFFNGKKKLSKNSFIKIIKYLQKWSNKNTKNLLKLCFVFLVQFFKINTTTIKGKLQNTTFLILYKNKNWAFLAIKFVIKTIQKNMSINFFKQLYKEIILILNNTNYVIKTKQFLQNLVVSKKHIFFYFRWR